MLPFDSAAARAYAAIAASRRSVGRPILEADCQIAAIARARDAAVATRNGADFEHCAIAVIDPWTDGDNAPAAGPPIRVSSVPGPDLPMTAHRPDNAPAAGLPSKKAPAQDGPLTATFENIPESHNGSGSFDITLRFSDQVFSLNMQQVWNENTQTWKRSQIRKIVKVKKGSITGVRAVNQRRTDAWKINVKPKGADPVIVFARPIADCAHQRAVCTADGRPLSNRPQASVGGPAYIRIADATAVEAPGATLD